MVKELLVGDQLSPEMIGFGANLVTRLDKLNVLVKGALWLLLPEPRVWRLIIATPEARTAGPKGVYRKIQSAIHKMSPEDPIVSIGDISVVDEKAPLFSLLRTAISTGPGIANIRFSRNVINGQVIEDAHIYRIM